jgi:putative acetyltransferase
MTQTVVIRSAQPSDAKQAAEFVFDILRSYNIKPDPDWLDRDIVTFGSGDHSRVREFAADFQGQVVGVATLNLDSHPKNEGLCTALYVRENFRAQGIGRRLLERVVEEAANLGCTKIRLETRSIFREAVRLYENMGWKRGPDLPSGYGPDRTYFFDLS